MKKILLIVGGIILVIIVIAAASDGGKSTQTQQASETKSDSSQTVSETPTETDKPKEWATVIEASGNANKRTDTFELKGGKTRLTYDVKGSTAPIASFYVLEEGTSLQEQGGFPEVTATQAGSDTTFLTKKAGNYYLDVTAANVTWTVKIEEER